MAVYLSKEEKVTDNNGLAVMQSQSGKAVATAELMSSCDFCLLMQTKPEYLQTVKAWSFQTPDNGVESCVHYIFYVFVEAFEFVFCRGCSKTAVENLCRISKVRHFHLVRRN